MLKITIISTTTVTGTSCIKINITEPGNGCWSQRTHLLSWLIGTPYPGLHAPHNLPVLPSTHSELLFLQL